MVDDYATTELLERAQDELDKFNDAVTPDRLLERLRRESPIHPLIIVYRMLLVCLSMGIVFSLAVLAVPLAGEELTRRVALLEMRIGFSLPVLLMVLGLCSGGLGAGARQFAVWRGMSSPLLPDELKVHQRLTSEVARLQSRRQLENRARTPPPAMNR